MCSTSVMHVYMIMMYNAKMCLTSKGVLADAGKLHVFN